MSPPEALALASLAATAASRPRARQDAWERVGVPRRRGLLLTAEHASNRVPGPWRLRPADRLLLGTHWGYDIGAFHLLEGLCHSLPASAVASRFSRLLIDPNRAPDDPSALLRRTPDGAPTFNRRADLSARVERFHKPYHGAIDATIRAWAPRFLLSVHTFTPSLRGVARPMHAGVLFDRYDDLALRLVELMNEEGLITTPNEPYSGKDGLIYSAARHGAEHALPYLEVEVRQDLLHNRHLAHHTAARVARALTRLGV